MACAILGSSSTITTRAFKPRLPPPGAGEGRTGPRVLQALEIDSTALGLGDLAGHGEPEARSSRLWW
jgi:hypothetical protein